MSERLRLCCIRGQANLRWNKLRPFAGAAQSLDPRTIIRTEIDVRDAKVRPAERRVVFVGVHPRKAGAAAMVSIALLAMVPHAHARAPRAMGVSPTAATIAGAAA